MYKAYIVEEAGSCIYPACNFCDNQCNGGENMVRISGINAEGVNCNTCDNYNTCDGKCINPSPAFCSDCNYHYGDNECNNCVYYDSE